MRRRRRRRRPCEKRARRGRLEAHWRHSVPERRERGRTEDSCDHNHVARALAAPEECAQQRHRAAERRHEQQHEEVERAVDASKQDERLETDIECTSNFFTEYIGTWKILVRAEYAALRGKVHAHVRKVGGEQECIVLRLRGLLEHPVEAVHGPGDGARQEERRVEHRDPDHEHRQPPLRRAHRRQRVARHQRALPPHLRQLHDREQVEEQVEQRVHRVLHLLHDHTVHEAHSAAGRGRHAVQA